MQVFVVAVSVALVVSFMCSIFESVLLSINHAQVEGLVEKGKPSGKILKAFKERTNSPVLINTSFNVRGEPIVRTSEDAYRCFMHTNMDVLVVDNFVLKKTEQPNAQIIDRDAYLKQFALD